MANLQVKNVPEKLHRELQRLAKLRRTTMGAVLLDAAQREVEQARFVERLHTRKPVNLGRAAAEFLDEARAERDRASTR